MPDLIIVESPTKAKTINRFLGKRFKVTSSYGHIIDLPKSKIGIDIDNNFSPEYVIPEIKKKIVSELKKQAKTSNHIYFATDEDREGEAIAWHLTSILNIDAKKAKRIVFHEITEEAINNALKNPKNININLVDAQQARRILDRLVGYELSPFLWKKVARGLSAGRVQSVAVRLIVEREKEIKKFQAKEYWTIEVDLQAKNDKIKTKLIKLKNKTLNKFYFPDKKSAEQVKQELTKAEFIIDKIEAKKTKRNPNPPFTTSSLQQTANRYLGFSAKQTMMLAQQLYEGIKLGSQGETGLITYMRTDSLNLANKFLNEAEKYIKNEIGKEYADRKIFKTKNKNAQEAHEAIRPTVAMQTPEKIKQYLNEKQYKLYKLIWQRSIASQMTAAEIEQTSIDIKANDWTLRATGSVISFPGWLKIFPEKINENNLPKINKNENLKLIKINNEQHYTQPPARYSEAGLVKALEEKGIGRPSTYAPTISTIQARNYVIKEDKRLKPTEIGIVVNDLLEKHFPKIVDYDFTANLENELDEIAAGKIKWQPIIKNFYKPFHENLTIKEKEVTKQQITNLKELGTDPKTGKPVSIRIGRFGPFIQLGTKDDEEKPKFASIKKDQNIEDITLSEALTLLSLPRVVGKDEDGNEITASIGRFGPYLKINEKFISIKDEDPYTIDETTAREIIKEYIKTGGKKIIKEFDKENISIRRGPYGLYLTDGKVNARLPKDIKPETVNINMAKELINKAREKKKNKYQKKH